MALSKAADKSALLLRRPRTDNAAEVTYTEPAI